MAIGLEQYGLRMPVDDGDASANQTLSNLM